MLGKETQVFVLASCYNADGRGDSVDRFFHCGDFYGAADQLRNMDWDIFCGDDDEHVVEIKIFRTQKGLDDYLDTPHNKRKF